MRSSAPTPACSLHDRSPPPASTQPTFITPAGDKTEWTTEVAVPQDVTSLYMLLSAETGKQRLCANYAIDITDQ
jgi:hypothetical protein